MDASEHLACARLMAASEPWLTLGRTVEAAFAGLQNPLKEGYVATPDSRPLGFLILDLQGPFPGYIQTEDEEAEEAGVVGRDVDLLQWVLKSGEGGLDGAAQGEPWLGRRHEPGAGEML